MSGGHPYTRRELRDALEWAAFQARAERARPNTTRAADHRQRRLMLTSHERVFNSLLADEAKL